MSAIVRVSVSRPGHPIGQEEAQVRLVGADEVGRRVHDRRGKGRRPVRRGAEMVRQARRIDVEADAEQAIVGLAGRPETLPKGHGVSFFRGGPRRGGPFA